MPIELLQPFLTVIGLASNSYSFLSGISHGQQLKAVRRQIQALDGRVQALSEKILYAPNFEVLKNIERRVTTAEIGQRKILEFLQPVQHVLDGTVLASRVIEAPADFRKEMHCDPWNFLTEVRPLRRMIDCAYRGKVPVLFFDNRTPYVGWIDPSVLTFDFKIRYCAGPSLRGSTQTVKRSYVDLGIRRMGYLKVYNYTTRNVSFTCSECRRRFKVTLQSNENYTPCPYCGVGQVFDVSW